MTDKLFDSFISNKLKNYESPLPDGLWEKIIAEEDKRKPAIIWWKTKQILLLAFAILFTTFSVGYYFNAHRNINNFRTLVENKKTIIITNNEKIGIENKENTSNSVEIVNNKKGIKKEKITAKDITEINDNNTSIAASKSKNNLNNNYIISKKITAEKSLQIEDLTANKNNFFIDNKIKNITPTFNLNKKNNPKFRKINDLKSSNYLKNYTKNEPVESKETKITNTNYKAFWASTIPLKNDLLHTKKLVNNNVLELKKLFNGTDDCPSTTGVIRNDLYIEGYASPDVAIKKISENTSGNNNYLSKKDSSETMLLGFTIGARLSKSLSNNLLLKAGLQYTQFNEKFTLRTENDRRQTIIINEHTIVRPGLPDTTISDTSISLQIGYRVRSNINRYKNLEIPLMLSYELSKPESNWQLAINAGAIVNVTSWYEGKTIDANYNPIVVGSKSNNSIYKSQVGISLYGGVTILRKIDEQIAVFAEPYFRYGISNSLQSSTGFTQKFNVIGLQFGARFKINKNKHL